MLRGELGREARLSACRVTDTCRDQSLPSVGPGFTPQAVPSQSCTSARPGPQPCSSAGLRFSRLSSLLHRAAGNCRQPVLGFMAALPWPLGRSFLPGPSPHRTRCAAPVPPGRARRAACNWLAWCGGRSPGCGWKTAWLQDLPCAPYGREGQLEWELGDVCPCRLAPLCWGHPHGTWPCQDEACSSPQQLRAQARTSHSKCI